MSAQPLKPGEMFAGYIVERPLGAGGMGAVYQVRHPELDKSFAMKILLESLGEQPSVVARFLREMRTVSALDHPNIVATAAGGSFEGHFWFTMTYVQGTDAQHALGNPPQGLPVQDAVSIVATVADALDLAHQAGIVHRDIKPANILLASGANASGTARVYLTDFGIAKAIDDFRSLTRTSHSPMTLDFASPEQISDLHLDGRTDVYSLGATLYTILTGSVPFPGTPVYKLNAHLNLPQPKPTALRSELPAQFDKVIAIAMAKDPRDRYQTCGELAAAARDALLPQTVKGTSTTIISSQTVKATSTTINSPTAIETGVSDHPGRVRGRRWRAGLLVIALVVAGGTSLIWVKYNNATTPAATAASSSSSQLPLSSDANTGSSASAELSTVGASLITTGNASIPLQELLNPAPEFRPGSTGGAAIASGAAYVMQPKGCPDGSRKITAALNQAYDRITGNIKLDDAAGPGTNVLVTTSADGTVLQSDRLNTAQGASFDLPVHDAKNVFLTFESLGQGSCTADDYAVFVTDAIAYPR